MSKGLSCMLQQLKSASEQEEIAAGVKRPFCFHRAGALLAHTTLRRVFAKSRPRQGQLLAHYNILILLQLPKNWTHRNVRKCWIWPFCWHFL